MIRRPLKGDEYIGRGSSQRGLGRSPCATPIRSEFLAESWHYRGSHKKSARIRSFENTCTVSQGSASYATACPRRSATPTVLLLNTSCYTPRPYDREDTKDAVPSSAVLSRLTQLRLELDSDDGSTPDEGTPKRGSGWTGRGSPLLVGSSYTVREVCDGQSLAFPGRWAVDDRRYLEDPIWSEVQGLHDLLRKGRHAGALGLVGSWEDIELSFTSWRDRRVERGVINFLQTKKVCCWSVTTKIEEISPLISGIHHYCFEPHRTLRFRLEEFALGWE